jgi:hypothetical protein
VEAFRQQIGKPLEDIGPDGIRHYQVHLLEGQKPAKGTAVLQVSALRFLYVRILNWRAWPAFRAALRD